jgi:endogenous inhibitor of DNA gyrase (YacG/DUF329 family)
MSSEAAKARPMHCPICGKSAVEDYRPFCSKRCADIDLGKWFSGSYSVDGRVEDEGDGSVANDGVERSEEGPQKR